MSEVFTATVEDGVLKLDQEIAIATGTKVRVTVEAVDAQVSTASRSEWAAELAARAESARAGDPVSTPQGFWDEARADRF